MFIEWPNTAVVNCYNSICFNKWKMVFVSAKEIIQILNDKANMLKLINKSFTEKTSTRSNEGRDWKIKSAGLLRKNQWKVKHLIHTQYNKKWYLHELRIHLERQPCHLHQQILSVNIGLRISTSQLESLWLAYYSTKKWNLEYDSFDWNANQVLLESTLSSRIN